MQMQKQIEALSRMTVGQLRQKYLEVFGEESRSNHKQFLFRRIAWRIQALAEGGLSERARRRALEIANDADLRIRAPRTCSGRIPPLDPELQRHPQGGWRPGPAAAASRHLPGARVQGPADHREGPGGRVRVRRADATGPSAPSPAKSPAPSGTASSFSTCCPPRRPPMARSSAPQGQRQRVECVPAHESPSGARSTPGSPRRKAFSRSSTRSTRSARRPRRSSSARSTKAGRWSPITSTTAATPAANMDRPALKRLLADVEAARWTAWWSTRSTGSAAP